MFKVPLNSQQINRGHNLSHQLTHPTTESIRSFLFFLVKFLSRDSEANPTFVFLAGKLMIEHFSKCEQFQALYLWWSVRKIRLFLIQKEYSGARGEKRLHCPPVFLSLLRKNRYFNSYTCFFRAWLKICVFLLPILSPNTLKEPVFLYNLFIF